MSFSRVLRAHAARAATVVVTGALLVVGLGAAATADHVPPSTMSGNPGCADLNASWEELKVEGVPNGTYSDSAGGETLQFTAQSADGRTLDWSSNAGVDAVIMKGGNAANVYRYDPEATADQSLTTPVNASGEPAGISHVSVCWDPEGDGDVQGEGDGEGDGQSDGDGNGDGENDGQSEGDGDGDRPGNQRPAAPNEPDDGDGDGQDEAQRPASPEEPRGGDQRRQGDDEDAGDQDGAQRPSDDPDRSEGGVRGEQEASPRRQDPDDDGEGGVRGVSETEEADEDVEEETASGGGSGDDDDELPFSGLPLVGLFLIGLGLTMTGAAGRALTRP